MKPLNKDDVLREVKVCLDHGEPLGFFSFAVTRVSTGRIVPTVTNFGLKAEPEKRDAVNRLLFKLAGFVRDVWVEAEAGEKEKGESCTE